MEAMSSFSGSLEVAMNVGMSIVNADRGKVPCVRETTSLSDGSYPDEDALFDGDHLDGSDVDALEDNDDNFLPFEDELDEKHYLFLEVECFSKRVIKTPVIKSGQVIELSNSDSEYKGRKSASFKKKRKSKPLK
ncbi:hypothetical protein BOTCAL_0963g00010 [Botryotinia calthae]|uniref:Uncharacterized protein n=1 Tax=Botryotinia calthae TaxID=38488 RepID=A0A4Y8CEH9_9HELO|nr:hypothetical protein BOTCAL_0963g00010 [Botryotinia calthae]